MSAVTMADSPLLPVALRDTARTVIALAEEPLSFDALRGQCNTQIDQLRSDLGLRGLPDHGINDAVYALCALLDEAALKHLTGEARESWEKRPLQEERFSRNDAGEELVRRIEDRLLEPRSPRVLLAIFAAVLSLGFTGRFAMDGSTARAALIRTLDERLGRTTAAEDNHAAPASIVVNRTNARPLRISPLTWVVASCVAVGVAWFMVDRWFIASIAQIAQ
ncbi:DotU family type IV/VI secretion system protein [Burkholderia vietnamiensis]|uniref:DotU family type IV/VI secretion system protein n=1 Tax=Burkholderia vietnamiensis TaxID=60552 RepID=UPI001B9EE2B2|nr:DotU/TssL family secretion system protein [Burkholderia vietnamiensis]MBR8031483.1 DotU family type IV/VI secretion system protein [Burkholderia vietnamiensis]